LAIFGLLLLFQQDNICTLPVGTKSKTNPKRELKGFNSKFASLNQGLPYSESKFPDLIDKFTTSNGELPSLIGKQPSKIPDLPCIHSFLTEKQS
jgi:hypothetical protein